MVGSKTRSIADSFMELITGKFDVRIHPLEDEFGNVHKVPERMSVDKQYFGGLKGTGKGQMLSHRTTEQGSAGYVAVEVIKAEIDGKSGSFVVQHSGIMDKGEKALSIQVIPDSGTGGLLGIFGHMSIEVINGQHFYQFNYDFK